MSVEASRTLRVVLATPINQVLQKSGKDPVWVMSTDTVDKAFKKLFKYKIRSLPLYDVTQDRFTDFIEVCGSFVPLTLPDSRLIAVCYTNF